MNLISSYYTNSLKAIGLMSLFFIVACSETESPNDDSPENESPVASNVSIVDSNGSTAVTGDTLSASYFYSDSEGDLEDASLFRWLRGAVVIPNTNNLEYVLTDSDQGESISFEVIPLASSGNLTGQSVRSNAIDVIMSNGNNNAPSASLVSILDSNGGTSVVGDSLTGSYSYTDAEGDAEGNSVFRWYRSGSLIANENDVNYSIVLADEGESISFEVAPVALFGTLNGTAVSSNQIDIAESNINSAPNASQVNIIDNNGADVMAGDELSASYSYTDADADLEGVSSYRWLRNGDAINGETSLTYMITASDDGTSLSFEVTPIAQTGVINGNAVISNVIVVGAASPITTNVRNYIFGHSLILHAFAPPTDVDFTNVPRWVHELSQQAGYTYGLSGQYGFEDTHANELPPNAQWGTAEVTPIWDEDFGETFADVDFNTIMFTAANFRQYYPPTEAEPNGFVPMSTVDSTLTVFDWVDQEESGVRYIIYENWPDMGAYSTADFETTFPTDDELLTYHNYTRGEFHDWWIDYQDAMKAQRPNLDVLMIPVGPILANLLTTTLSDVPVTELYEDNAPHGKPTLYFLAGMVTYMALYGVEAPANYVVPNTIDVRVRSRYTQIAAEIWTELQDFVDAQGNSRVFPD